MELRFLYVGVSDTSSALATWLALPGARLRWRFRRFGADVAGVDLGSPPLLLLADHRPVGSVLPIYSVDDLDAAGRELLAGGWTAVLGPTDTPEGQTTLWRGIDGVELALLKVERPDALDGFYTHEGNTFAVRDG